MSLITNPSVNLRNSRWQIQHGGRIFKNQTLHQIGRKRMLFGVAEHEFEVKFLKIYNSKWKVSESGRNSNKLTFYTKFGVQGGFWER